MRRNNRVVWILIKCCKRLNVVLVGYRIKSKLVMIVIFLFFVIFFNKEY